MVAYSCFNSCIFLSKEALDVVLAHSLLHFAQANRVLSLRASPEETLEMQNYQDSHAHIYNPHHTLCSSLVWLGHSVGEEVPADHRFF